MKPFFLLSKKHLFVSFFTLLCFVPLSVKAEEIQAQEELSADVLSETIGHMIAKHLQAPGLTVNFDKVIQGIRDSQEGKSSPLSEEEYEKAIANLQEKLFVQASEKNLNAANAFLTQNAAATGIICLNEKIQYKVNAKVKASALQKILPL